MYEILDKNKAALIIWIDIHLHVFCIGKWRTYVMGISCVFSSVQSLSRVWLLRPHEPQHTKPPMYVDCEIAKEMIYIRHFHIYIFSNLSLPKGDWCKYLCTPLGKRAFFLRVFSGVVILSEIGFLWYYLWLHKRYVLCFGKLDITNIYQTF